MAPSPLHIQHLSVQYRSVEALHDISCTLQPGRLTGIIGPNGAGKSTLLKAMLGLIDVQAGSVSYQGRPLAEQLEQVAYVPQRSQIDWTYPATVWDVVMMGRVRRTGWLRRYSTVSRRLAAHALERVGMAEYRDRPIGQLSGGQQQRVFLARALSEEAQIFCLDEPLAGIDKKTEAVIFGVLRELAAAGQMVVVVHHDLSQAMTYFDDLVLLNRTLIATGPQEQVLVPTHLQRAFGGMVPLTAQRTAA